LYPLKKQFLSVARTRVYYFYFFPFFSFATIFSLSSFSFPFFSLCSLFSLGFLVVDSVAWAWWFGLADLGVVVDSVAWACLGLRCRDRPGVGFALPRFGVVGLRWVWVFAEAHQLEDLFMEPWVEATCGGGGEIWVCSSRSGFFFFLIL
jgi:hypothetical protein